MSDDVLIVCNLFLLQIPNSQWRPDWSGLPKHSIICYKLTTVMPNCCTQFFLWLSVWPEAVSIYSVMCIINYRLIIYSRTSTFLHLKGLTVESLFWQLCCTLSFVRCTFNIHTSVPTILMDIWIFSNLITPCSRIIFEKCSWSNSLLFVEPEGSLVCLQQPTTGPYPEADESSLPHPTYLSILETNGNIQDWNTMLVCKPQKKCLLV